MATRQSLFVLICLAALPAVAEEASDHLARAADAYSRLKSLQVEAVSEGRTADGRNSRAVVVRVYTSGRDKARIETVSTSSIVQSLLISNGKDVTEYRGWTNEYTRLPATSISVQFAPERATGRGEMSYETVAQGVTKASVKARQILQIGDDRIRCVVVDAEYGIRLPKYTFWIAEDSGLILRRMVTFWSDEGAATVVATVRALTINEEISDSAFEFIPPSDAKEVPLPTDLGVAAER
jgi:outer membrane lipoprotein-sorting protein